MCVAGLDGAPVGLVEAGVTLEPGERARDPDLLGERIVRAKENPRARHELVEAAEDGVVRRQRHVVEQALQLPVAVGKPLVEHLLKLRARRRRCPPHALEDPPAVDDAIVDVGDGPTRVGEDQPDARVSL